MTEASSGKMPTTFERRLKLSCQERGLSGVSRHGSVDRVRQMTLENSHRFSAGVTDDVCEDIPGDLQIEKSDGGIELTEGDVAPFEYQLTVTNVGGASTGDSVTVTDVLPDEFVWFDFPDTAGEFPFCSVGGSGAHE